MTELFFSDSQDDVDKAKAACRGCPFRRACLQRALDLDRSHLLSFGKSQAGVWGGFTPDERSVWAKINGLVVGVCIPELPFALNIKKRRS